MEANLESASAETGATELSVDDAANALMSKWESEDAPTEENNEPEAQAEEEVIEAEESVEETDELSDVESDGQEAESEEEALNIESITDIAEALDLTPEAFLEQVKGKVKLDGEESEISLSEALNGYQRQADYQRKTAELAENRRQFEEAAMQQQNEIAQRNQIAQASLQAAENVLMQEFNGINWAELEATDAGTAALYRQKFQERQSEIQNYYGQLQQQQQYEQQVAQQQQSQELQRYVSQQQEALMKADPSWSADKSKALRDYLVQSQFSEQEVNSMVDHRHALIAHKAMLYDQSQKSVEVAKAKVKPLPKMLKPNSKAQKTAKQKSQDKLRSKLRRSGSVNDAAALLLDRM